MSDSNSRSTTPVQLTRKHLSTASNATIAANEKHVLRCIREVLDYVEKNDIPQIEIQFNKDYTLVIGETPVFKIIVLWLSRIFFDCEVTYRGHSIHSSDPQWFVTISWAAAAQRHSCGNPDCEECSISDEPQQETETVAAFALATCDLTRTPVSRAHLIQRQFHYTCDEICRRCVHAVQTECRSECAFSKKYYKVFDFNPASLKCFRTIPRDTVISMVSERLAKAFPDCKLTVTCHTWQNGVTVEIDWNE